jgi:hypothetical protein
MQIAPFLAAAHDSASASISTVLPPAPPVPTTEAATVSISNSTTSPLPVGQTATAETPRLENMVAGIFSTTIKGKNYSGSIEDSGNEYIGSVSNVPGASAAGPNVQFVEISLGQMVDTLV